LICAMKHPYAVNEAVSGFILDSDPLDT
jgi:hypothetical protein